MSVIDGFKVHTAYIAEVKRELGLPMYDAPNAVEELKQPRKHPTAEKAEAIKDALKYFNLISDNLIQRRRSRGETKEDSDYKLQTVSKCSYKL